MSLLHAPPTKTILQYSTLNLYPSTIVVCSWPITRPACRQTAQATVYHSNKQECIWGLDNKVEFTPVACQERANNSSVWQLALLKPCRSTLFLTGCYLKSVCLPEVQSQRLNGKLLKGLRALGQPCLLISNCHFKKLPSYLNTMGGCLVGNRLRNGEKSARSFCPGEDNIWREIGTDRGIRSQCESVDDMLSTR